MRLLGFVISPWKTYELNTVGKDFDVYKINSFLPNSNSNAIVNDVFLCAYTRYENEIFHETHTPFKLWFYCLNLSDSKKNIHIQEISLKDRNGNALSLGGNFEYPSEFILSEKENITEGHRKWFSSDYIFYFTDKKMEYYNIEMQVKISDEKECCEKKLQLTLRPYIKFGLFDIVSR